MERFPHGATRAPGPARPGNGFGRTPRRPGPWVALRWSTPTEAPDLTVLLDGDPEVDTRIATAAPAVDAASE